MTYLVAVPSVVITLAGIKAASSSIVPLLLAFILATIGGFFILYLSNHGLPRWLSRLIVLLAIVLLVMGLGLFICSAAIEFSNKIPYYQAQFLKIMDQLPVTLNNQGVRFERSELLHPWSPMMIMGYVAAFLQNLQMVLADQGVAMLVWVGLYFLLINIVFGVKEYKENSTRLRQ